MPPEESENRTALLEAESSGFESRLRHRAAAVWPAPTHAAASMENPRLPGGSVGFLPLCPGQHAWPAGEINPKPTMGRRWAILRGAPHSCSEDPLRKSGFFRLPHCMAASGAVKLLTRPLRAPKASFSVDGTGSAIAFYNLTSEVTQCRFCFIDRLPESQAHLDSRDGGIDFTRLWPFFKSPNPAVGRFPMDSPPALILRALPTPLAPGSLSQGPFLGGLGHLSLAKS